MTAPFPSIWWAMAYIAVGSVTDRVVVARLGWTLERTRDWFLFGAAHWFWPAPLAALVVVESFRALTRAEPSS